ncbi:MAG: hypothetical protein LBR11_09140 [Deltaproteobacteria bacterium]|jgi:homocitrate synthase NifV|nr:hypothetical protein [Deltaproteobacteria bacterium]
MLLIDATLPALSAAGLSLDPALALKWAKALAALGVSRVKRPREPLVASDALYGLDGVFRGDYPSLFKKLRRLGPLEMVFGDERGWATALAASWLEEGGSGVVCSLVGVGGLPALEQLRLILHLSGRMLLPKLGRELQALGQLFEELSGRELDLFQPVLGRGLFAGEAGVHVDSWPKDPTLYEPFGPEMVGARRVLAIGRHSGQGALRLKCLQLGLSCPRASLPSLLRAVRAKAAELERSLTDAEFAELTQASSGGQASRGGQA